MTMAERFVSDHLLAEDTDMNWKTWISSIIATAVTRYCDICGKDNGCTNPMTHPDVFVFADGSDLRLEEKDGHTTISLTVPRGVSTGEN
jgi:hypothetical protein